MLEAFKIQRLMEYVFHYFTNEWVVGNLNGAIDIFLTCGSIGENGGQQVCRASALHLKRNLFAVPVTEQSKGAVRVPAPASLQQRRKQCGLLQNFFDCVFVEEIEDISEREAVLLRKGDVDAVIRGCGLKFEIE